MEAEKAREQIENAKKEKKLAAKKRKAERIMEKKKLGIKESHETFAAKAAEQVWS